MMDESTSRRYTAEEVNRIIRRALKIKKDDTVRHQDLIETAREIGIEADVLENAIEQEQREYKREKIRRARQRRRKAGFYSHLTSYLLVNAGLLVINQFTPGPYWFHWPLFGWGIGLAFHFKAVFFGCRKKRSNCYYTTNGVIYGQ